MLCSKCRKYKKSFFKELIKMSFLSVMFFTSFIGIFALINFQASSFKDNEDLSLSLGGAWAAYLNARILFLNHFDKPMLIENFTPSIKSCSDNECKALNIYFDILNNYNYKEGYDFNVNSIIEKQSGDCDELSYLYVSALKSFNIKSKLQCGNNHCWSIVSLENKEILADITKFKWEEHEKIR